jgi:hypothetical protein
MSGPGSGGGGGGLTTQQRSAPSCAASHPAAGRHPPPQTGLRTSHQVMRPHASRSLPLRNWYFGHHATKSRTGFGSGAGRGGQIRVWGGGRRGRGPWMVNAHQGPGAGPSPAGPLASGARLGGRGPPPSPPWRTVCQGLVHRDERLLEAAGLAGRSAPGAGRLGGAGAQGLQRSRAARRPSAAAAGGGSVHPTAPRRQHRPPPPAPLPHLQHAVAQGVAHELVVPLVKHLGRQLEGLGWAGGRAGGGAGAGRFGVSRGGRVPWGEPRAGGRPPRPSTGQPPFSQPTCCCSRPRSSSSHSR